MYDLYIANKNYSSWSLRPWVLMRELKIAFAERLMPFGATPEWDDLRRISPSGKGALPGRRSDGGVGLARHRRIFGLSGTLASGQRHRAPVPGPAAPAPKCTPDSASCAPAVR